MKIPDLKKLFNPQVLLIVVIAGWVITATLPFLSILCGGISHDRHEIWKDVLEQWSLFGGIFNALNTLLTGLALYGLFTTYELQVEQLTILKKEVKDAENERERLEKERIAEQKLADIERMNLEKARVTQQVLAAKTAILTGEGAILALQGSIIESAQTPGSRQQFIKDADEPVSRVQALIEDFKKYLNSIEN